MYKMSYIIMIPNHKNEIALSYKQLISINRETHYLSRSNGISTSLSKKLQELSKSIGFYTLESLIKKTKESKIHINKKDLISKLIKSTNLDYSTVSEIVKKNSSASEIVKKNSFFIENINVSNYAPITINFDFNCKIIFGTNATAMSNLRSH